MIEKKVGAKRAHPPPKTAFTDEDLKQCEEQMDTDSLIFIRWAVNLYRNLKSGIPKSYVIEGGEVLQNPEHITWRENLKSLKSNLESRISKGEALESDMNLRETKGQDIYDLYHKVLKLEHASAG